MGATIDGAQSLLEAIGGDHTRLLQRLRDPTVVLDTAEREFLADKLEGKIKEKRGPKRTAEKDFEKIRTLLTCEWLIKVEGWPKEAAELRAAELQKKQIGTGNKETVRRYYDDEIKGYQVFSEIVDQVARGRIPKEVGESIIPLRFPH